MTLRNRSSQVVVYDPQAHREFVTGFRKRKQARRQQAQADIQRNAKEARRQMRQEKRDFFKNSRLRLLPHDSDDSDGDSDGDPDDAVVRTFDAEDGAAVVTASVAPLDTPSSRPRETHQPTPATAPSSKLPVRSAIRKIKSRRRHVSYTHAHHKPRPPKGQAKRTTHSQRRKRDTNRASRD